MPARSQRYIANNLSSNFLIKGLVAENAEDDGPAVTDEMHDVQVRCFASGGLGVDQNLLVEKAHTVQVQ